MKISILTLWVCLSFMGNGAECKRDKKDEGILQPSAFIDRVKGMDGSGALRKYRYDEDKVVGPSYHRFLKKRKDKKNKKQKPLKGRSRKKSADKLIKSGKKSKNNGACLDLLPGPILDFFQQIMASTIIPGGSKTSIPNTVPPTRSGKKASPFQETLQYDANFDQICCLASGLRGTLGFDWSDLLTGFAASNGACPSTWDGGELKPGMAMPPAALDTSISSMMENDAFRIMNEMIVETMSLTQSEFYSALDDLLSFVSDDLDAMIVGDEVMEDNEIQFMEPFLGILKCWVDPAAGGDSDYDMCSFLLQLPGIAFVFAVTPYILPACDCHYKQDLNCAAQTCQPTDVNTEVLVSTLDEAVDSIVENESLLNNDDEKNSTTLVDIGNDEWSNDEDNSGETDTKDYKEWSNDGNDYNSVGGNDNTSNEYEDWSNDSSVFRSHLDGGGDRKTKSVGDDQDSQRRSLNFENMAEEGLTHVGTELFGLLMSCSAQQETCRGYCALHSNPSISVTEVCSLVQNFMN